MGRPRHVSCLFSENNNDKERFIFPVHTLGLLWPRFKQYHELLLCSVEVGSESTPFKCLGQGLNEKVKI